MVRELVEADVDFIKDDEKLMSPAYSSLADRVKAIMPIILDREQKTGKKVMYAFGISHADPEVMLRNHDIVANAGGNAAVININSIGYGGFAYLRKRSRLVAARASQRLGHPHPPSRPRPGLSRLSAILAAARRRSVPDQRHRRQILGAGRVLRPLVSRRCRTPLFSPSDRPLPVAGSGQWGGQAPETFARTGRTQDLLYLCGGGVVSHPGGPAAGVRAVRQAWEAAVAGVRPRRLRARSSRTRASHRQIRRTPRIDA